MNPMNFVDGVISTQSKSVPQLAAEIFGSSSNFRELFDLYEISPFDPQQKIDGLLKIESVREARESIGVIGEQVIEVIGNLKSVANDPIVLDWLMN